MPGSGRKTKGCHSKPDTTGLCSEEPADVMDYDMLCRHHYWAAPGKSSSYGGLMTSLIVMTDQLLRILDVIDPGDYSSSR